MTRWNKDGVPIDEESFTGSPSEGISREHLLQMDLNGAHYLVETVLHLSKEALTELAEGRMIRAAEKITRLQVLIEQFQEKE